MKVRFLHPWNLSPQEAMEIQKELAPEVREEHLPWDWLKLVAGVDVSFNRGSSIGFAGVVVMEYPSLQVVEKAGARGTFTMPYIPGLLSFRETPLIIEAMDNLKNHPHVILVDGNGVAHPRGLGLASHLGIILDIPTVGCAKSRLLGHHREPGPQKGAWAPWYHQDRLLGVALRSREGTKPIYVSVGHRVTLEDALQLVLSCCPRYRIPEPIRAAHKEVNRLREEG